MSTRTVLPRRAAMRLLILVGVLGLLQPAARAWTDASRTRLLQGAVPMMPESLREMMEAYQKELLAGMLSPGSPEDRPEHWQHPGGEYGSAARRAEEEARAIAADMDAHAPLGGVVRRFGALAHWIADINDPLHAADRDPNLKNYYRDYQSYLEETLELHPLVFHGYRSASLSRLGPGGYLMESAARSREYAVPVRAAYRADGTRLSAQAFDERSLAFGVGSLSYSFAVNDIIRVWLWAWELCHGDTAGTPYPLEPAAGNEPGDASGSPQESAP